MISVEFLISTSQILCELIIVCVSFSYAETCPTIFYIRGPRLEV